MWQSPPLATPGAPRAPLGRGWDPMTPPQEGVGNPRLEMTSALGDLVTPPPVSTQTHIVQLPETATGGVRHSPPVEETILVQHNQAVTHAPPPTREPQGTPVVEGASESESMVDGSSLHTSYYATPYGSRAPSACSSEILLGDQEPLEAGRPAPPLAEERFFRDPHGNLCITSALGVSSYVMPGSAEAEVYEALCAGTSQPAQPSAAGGAPPAAATNPVAGSQRRVGTAEGYSPRPARRVRERKKPVKPKYKLPATEDDSSSSSSEEGMDRARQLIERFQRGLQETARQEGMQEASTSVPGPLRKRAARLASTPPHQKIPKPSGGPSSKRRPRTPARDSETDANRMEWACDDEGHMYLARRKPRDLLRDFENSIERAREQRDDPPPARAETNYEQVDMSLTLGRRTDALSAFRPVSAA